MKLSVIVVPSLIELTPKFKITIDESQLAKLTDGVIIVPVEVENVTVSVGEDDSY